MTSIQFYPYYSIGSVTLSFFLSVASLNSQWNLDLQFPDILRLESNIFRMRLPNMRLYNRLLSIEPTSWFYFLITDCQTPCKTMVSKPNDGYFHPKSKQNNYVMNFYMDCQLDIISG